MAKLWIAHRPQDVDNDTRSFRFGMETVTKRYLDLILEQKLDPLSDQVRSHDDR